MNLKLFLYRMFLYASIIGVVTSLTFALVYVLLGISTYVVLLCVSLSFLVTVVLFVYTYWMYKYNIYVSSDELAKSVSHISTISPEEMQGGVIIYDEFGKVTYITRWLLERGFKKFLGWDIGMVGIKLNESLPQQIKVRVHYYQLMSYEKTRTVFVRDITDVERLSRYIKSKQQGVILVETKFYSALKLNDTAKLKTELVIREQLENWTKRYGGVFKTSTSQDEPYTIIINWKRVKTYFQKETDTFFNNLSKELGDLKKNVSISIGISFGNFDLLDLTVSARESLQLASQRGGDQTVIKDNLGKLVFLGKSSIGQQEEARVEIKFYYESFMTKIRKAGNIFVTAHKYADLDALGSSLAMAWFLKTEVNKDTFIILPQVDQSTAEAMKTLTPELSSMFISEKEATERANSKSALVITDVNSIERTQTEKLATIVSNRQIFVIDHHRIIKKSELVLDENMYLDTNASSAVEIVSELLRFHFPSKTIPNFNTLGTVMLSGVYLDTNKLSKATSPRTYDSVSWLVKNGANEDTAVSFNRFEFDQLLKYYAELYKVTEKITDRVVLAPLPESLRIDDAIVSLLADKLLEYKDIDASIVIGKNANGDYKASLRANKNFNVQYVAEKLGGGGHFTASAALFPQSKYKYKDAISRIKDEVQALEKMNKTDTKKKERKSVIRKAVGSAKIKSEAKKAEKKSAKEKAKK